ncbi:MAG: hypothetical protein GF334_12105, partial [Candidatus Altiarchaeales archaeon]|nr:hypothetical protein [Candidatus Altiarchaeales archaeon]
MKPICRITTLFMLSLLLINFSTAGNAILDPVCDTLVVEDWIQTLRLEDVDSDGKPTIYVGTGGQGTVAEYEYSYPDCTLNWEARHKYMTGGSVLEIEFGDLNSDGVTDLLVNGRPSPTSNQPSKFIYLLDSRLLTRLWDDEKTCAQSNTVSSADLDDDGVPNIVSGADSGLVCAYEDAVTKQEKIMWMHRAPFKVFAVYAQDLGGDGQAEVLVASGRNRLWTTIQKLGSQGKVEWEKNLSGGLMRPGKDLVKVVDVTGDGRKEVVV